MQVGMNMMLWTTRVTEAHAAQLELLKGLGYDLVEVPVVGRSPDELAPLARLLDRIGLARTTSTVRLAADNPLSPDAAARRGSIEIGKRWVDCALALGATKVVGPVHSAHGVFSGQGPTADEWQRGVEVMRAVGEYAAGHGVAIGVEPLNRFECYLLNTAGDGARFCRDVGLPNVGVLYDTHHANIEEDDVGAAIRDNAAAINHIHISESHRGTPGTGQVHWAETFAALRAAGYDGILMIEAFGLAIPELIPVVKIWRRLFESEEQLARDGIGFIRRGWAQAP